MINLLHLQYFYEVARLRSFSGAARTVRISQPALSQMVRKLEDSLGQKLLERSTRRMALTPAGEQLLSSAERIFGEVHSAQERLAGMSKKLRGIWGLALSDNLAHYFAPRLLVPFKNENPELRLHVFVGTSRQIQEEILAGRSQLGIFYTPPQKSLPLQFEILDQTEFWVVVSPQWVQGKRKLRVADLDRLQIPRVEARHHDYSGGFPAHFHSRRLGLRSHPWLEVNSHEAKKQLLLSGAGYSLLVRESVEAEVQTGRLVRLATAFPLTAPIYCVWRKGQSENVATRRFIAHWKLQRARTGVSY